MITQPDIFTILAKGKLAQLQNALEKHPELLDEHTDETVKVFVRFLKPIETLPETPELFAIRQQKDSQKIVYLVEALYKRENDLHDKEISHQYTRRRAAIISQLVLVYDKNEDFVKKTLIYLFKLAPEKFPELHAHGGILLFINIALLNKSGSDQYFNFLKWLVTFLTPSEKNESIYNPLNICLNYAAAREDTTFVESIISEYGDRLEPLTYAPEGMTMLHHIAARRRAVADDNKIATRVSNIFLYFQKNHLQAVEAILLDKNQKCTQRNAHGETVLGVAVKNNNTYFLDLLLHFYAMAAKRCAAQMGNRPFILDLGSSDHFEIKQWRNFTEEVVRVEKKNNASFWTNCDITSSVEKPTAGDTLKRSGPEQEDAPPKRLKL